MTLGHLARAVPLTGKQFRITAGSFAAAITEVGAGLRQFSVDGIDVTCRFDEDELPPKCSGCTLVPWPNRIRGGAYTFDGVDHQLALTEPEQNNAIHGLGRWERWAKVRQAADSITLRLDIVPQKGYPFPLRTEVTYALDPAEGLSVTLSARNVSTRRAPFGAGSHPFLSTRGQPLEQTVVRLPARTVLVTDEAQIPVGAKPVSRTSYDFRRAKRLGGVRLDSGFTGIRYDGGLATAEVRTRSGGARLWFEEAFGYLQVFTKEDVTPGQHGVAIEPMTCPADAFNSGDGLIVLQPGQQWSGRWGVAPL